jgi:hypothetical protein
MRDLRAGRMPPMVSWYDPRLLTRIGIRTIISNVFGQYADQRLIQAATDTPDEKELVGRYDFRDPTPDDPLRRVQLDDQGAFWVDYLSDTGDGFESTLAMASLLAQPELPLPGGKRLPAGDTLIMGGDQCYPQATREDYKKRLQSPFEWAYDVDKPERKLFAIPGNHDWYDGLNAFDGLFCSSRDRLSKEHANTIGGYQCLQHRSYWALRLPYNWWIWGCDIQFSKYLDISQINYFRAVAQSMGAQDKVILCIAEPSWMLAEMQGADEEANFFKITAIARERQSRICAVIAGDWHHYNRYYAHDLDVHFITAGGGGSFLHPTHVLREHISVKWPERVDEPSAEATAAQTGIKGRWQAQDYDIRLKNKKDASNVGTSAQNLVGGVGGAVTDAARSVQDAISLATTPTPAAQPVTTRRRALKPQAPKCYPEKSTSVLLSLRNLFFPIYNPAFAIGLGFVYWVITWQFYNVAVQNYISSGKIDTVNDWPTYFSTLRFLPLYIAQAALVSISFALLLMGLFALLVWYAEGVEKPVWRRWLTKFGIGTAHFTAHVGLMFALGFMFSMFNNWMAPPVQRYIDAIYRDTLKKPATGEQQAPSVVRDVVRGVVRETIEPLSQEKAAEREVYQTQRGVAAPTRQLPAETMRTQDVTAVEPKAVRQILGLIMYPLEMIILGGFAAGLLWGLYWVLTGLFRMHAEDAFAALRVRDYKNFLRLKFERDRLTIYPIGIDRLPRRRDWTTPHPDRPRAPHNPRVVPIKPIEIRLIEDPIVIDGSSIMEAHVLRAEAAE